MVYANRTRLYRLWIVAPWIGSREFGRDPVATICDALATSRCAVNIFTRPPDLRWHSEALAKLRSTGKATVFLAPHLHTKLYILECDGFRAALVGSPNLTPGAEQRNRELAIEFRTTESTREDPVSALISDLSEYAWSLRGEVDVDLL
jgi:phosphatidylserine/phosphatidylglycerophosphate/cardiolipin synthase-like enzyme